MDTIDDQLSEAANQLPAAFAIQSELPFSDRIISFDEDLLFDDNSLLLPRMESERSDETIEDLELANSEAGFEAAAFYISFHNRTTDGQWGIFYWDDAIRAFAAKISRDLRISDRKKCARLAMEIIRKHELFHYHFDLFALQQELTLVRPLYNRYHGDVYSKVLFTEECYEESLANASCASGWTLYQTLAQGLATRSIYRSPILSIEEFIEFLRIDETQQAAVTSLLAGMPSPIDEFVFELCRKAPPGYRDFNRSPNDLRSGLGGQLLTGSINAKIPIPQSAWVGRPGAFAARENCPEYVLVTTGTEGSGVLRLIVRNSGEIWEFHKYDPDPWPSKPHGHNRETGEKLDLASGMVYDRNRKPRRRCAEKSLMEMRTRIEMKWPAPFLPPLS
jgi:hypothetical protein